MVIITGTSLPTNNEGHHIHEISNLANIESKLDSVITNTGNINVNVGDVEINTQELENKLDTFSGAGNNDIGEGSVKLQIYNYGRNVASGKFKPMVVNSSAEQIVALSATDNGVLDDIKSNTGSIEGCVESNKVNVNISTGGFDGVVSGTVTANLSATDNAVLDAIETSLTSMEGKQDNMITALQILDNCISGNEAQVDVLTMPTTTITGTVTANLSATDNAVLDAIAVDGDNIQTKLDTLIGHSDGVEGKLDHLSDNSDTLNSSITAVTAAVDALRVQNNGDLNDNIGKLDHISDNLDTIDGSINTLEACVGSNKVNVNISSGGFDGVVSGTVTANLSATDNGVLDDIAQKLGDIETAVQLIDDCVAGNELQVDIVSGGGGATARLTIATGTSELAHNELVGSVDCSAFSDICVMYPTSQSNNALRLFVKGATSQGGTYHTFAQMSRKELVSNSGGGETTTYIWGTGGDQNNATFIPCLYDHIKIQNVSGTNFADSDAIRIVGK